VPGDAENNQTAIGPIYFDFNAPRVTDESEVTIEGKSIEEAFYSGKRSLTDGRSQRVWISNVSEGGSGGQYGSTTQIVAVGDCSISANTDTGERGAGTAFEALFEDVNTIGELPEDDPYGDELSDDGGVQCYTAELQSITDPIGNARALNNVRIRSAENFGVDKTGPEIDDLVPDEELVLMNGAVLTFEVDDPDLETGENSSGLDEESPWAYWGPSSSWSQRYFYSTQEGAAEGVVSDVEDGVVTIMTDGDDEIDKERRYVVVALVQDNAVPPNRSSTSFAYTRDSEGPAISLSKSQSDIGRINTATVTVGVGGTISDKNVIKVADLSIRMVANDAGADACEAADDLSQGRTGRVVRNRRDLENDTNKIEFDETFTIRKPTGAGVGMETYCFWLASADVAVNANGRGDGNPGNYELGRFSVGWPETDPRVTGPTFEFFEVDTTDGSIGDDPIEELELAEGTSATYAVKLTEGTEAEVTLTAAPGVTVNLTSLTFPHTDGTSDTLNVTVTAAHDRDVANEEITVTHSADDFGDGTLTVTSMDDDVTLTVRESSITEGDDAKTFHVVATLTNEQTADVTAGWSFGGGSAAASGDWTATGVADITITAGDMSDSVEVTLSGDDDVLIEGDETVNAQQTSASEAPYLVPAAVTIMDDDPNLTLMVTPSALNEGDDATTLTISATSTVRMPGVLNVEVSIPLGDGYTVNGEAAGGTAQSVTLTIDTGDTESNSMTVSVDPQQDDDSNNITFEITGPAAGVQVGGAGKTYSVKGAMVTITDDDSS